jgi:hypothetical protein
MDKRINIEAERADFEAWREESCIRSDLGAWEAWQASAARFATGATEDLPPLPDEVALRKILKEIPLCYPWGTGHKLVREGESREWTSVRESTNAAQTLADRNQNIVNSTIAAVSQAIAHYLRKQAGQVEGSANGEG